MPWINEQEVAKAHQIDLLTYLESCEPHELRQTAPHEYRTVSNDSLVISNGLWRWNSRGIGGRNAIDFLVKVRGMEFTDAVRSVLGARASFVLPVKKEEVKRFDFYPPKPQKYSNKAVSYLQHRGISAEVINQALKSGIFYESRYYNPKSKYHNAAVCVFAGKNKSGKVVFAALRVLIRI